MIEIVRAKAPRAKQPWHVRVRAEGNAEPILAGETLTEQTNAGESVAALGRLFSPVHLAEYVGNDAGGVLTVWLDEDDEGEKLHIPVEVVDEREPEGEAETEPEKPPAKKAAAKKAAAADGGTK